MSKSSNQAELEAVEVPLLLKQQVRVLFGMTGRQVLVVVCGLAIGFSLWQSVVFFQTFGGTALVLCVCVLPAVLLAFLKIDGRPVEQWLLIMITWMLTPEHLPLPLLLQTFVKVRRIENGMVALDLGRRGGQLFYQAVLCVESRSFDLLAASEQATIIDAFGKMLNGLSYPVTIHIRVLPYRPVALASTLIPSYITGPLRRFHAHYLSFLSQTVQKKQPVRVSYYVIISAEEHQLEQAKGQLTNRVHELSRQLARASLSYRLLSSFELFMFYHESFLPQERLTSVPSDTVLHDAGQLTALLSPREMSISASWVNIEGQQGGTQYIACLALERLPRKVYPGWLHRILAMNEPYIDISMQIQPHESDVVAAQLRRKAVMLGGALLAAKQQGESGGNTITRYALKDVERVRERMMQDAHLYSVTLLFLVRAPSRDELNERVKRLQLALRSLDFQATLLRFQHHVGYFSSLYSRPMLNHYAHLLPTEAVAAFYPFGKSPTMDKGVLLGITAGGNLVSMNVDDGMNANLAVLGVPGSGKSFFLKMILSRLAPSTKISVIDIEGEYVHFIRAIGGDQIDLTAQSFQFNPLELRKRTPIQEEKGQVFREKITMLIGFFALLLGDNGIVTQHESAVIQHCLIRVYAAAGITADPETHTRPAPSMQKFVLALKQEEPTSDLALRLESYLHLFPLHTQLPNASQHIVYTLKELPEALRPAATYLITERLWSELQAAGKEEATTRHLVVIDEAWFLSKFPAGAALLNEFARRVRKYGGGLWLGTQQLTDMLSSSDGRNLIALCETKLLFRQDVSSSDAVRTVLHLSEAQCTYLTTARRGDALYMTSKDVLAIEICASEQEAAIAVTTQGGNQKR